jgi:frataxin-like iron-binding protein CyaY
MNTPQQNLLQLGASLTTAQGSLTEMQGAVINITQQLNDVLAKSLALQGDISVAAISMRDHIALLLAQWGVKPVWVSSRISGFQLSKDENGNYIRDEKGNFIVQ